VTSPDYQRYHDEEWGVPVVDEIAIYEKLCLEGFQSGLSWLTILRKREGFRRAFAGFDPEVVARFRARDVTRLLADASIVRHRGKIEATIANARAVLDVRSSGETLSGLLWHHESKARRAPRVLAEIPAKTPESIALSKALRSRGFRFVGPTTAYAAMQSLGVVNDHLARCPARKRVDALRAALVRP
jgi:DNA-3-methyladenine glycosylase I